MTRLKMVETLDLIKPLPTSRPRMARELGINRNKSTSLMQLPHQTAGKHLFSVEVYIFYHEIGLLSREHKPQTLKFITIQLFEILI